MGDKRAIFSAIIGILIIGSLSFGFQNYAHAGGAVAGSVLIDKTVDTDKVLAGGTVTYSYQAANDGIGDLTGCLITDDLLGAIAGPFNLAQGATSAVFQAVSGPIVGTTVNTATVLCGDEAGNPVSDSDSVTVTVIIPVDVDIDIKPGSDPNSIKVNKRGVIPVAILGSASFDVGDVDVTTLVFAGASPAHDLTDPDTLAEHTEDVNGDGIDDLVSHYITNETSIVCSNTSATLTGQLNDGTPFSGTDSVRTVPCK